MDVTVKRGEIVTLTLEGSELAFEVYFNRFDVMVYADGLDDQDRSGVIFRKAVPSSEEGPSTEDRIREGERIAMNMPLYQVPARPARIGHAFRVWRPASKQFLDNDGRWTIQEHKARNFVDLRVAAHTMRDNRRVRECPDLFEIIEMVL